MSRRSIGRTECNGAPDSSMRFASPALICAGYACIGLLLYRQRVTTSSGWLSSDMVVFAAPAVIAVAAVWTSLKRRGHVSGPIVRAFVAVTAIALSFLAYMFVAANLYGT